MHLRLLPVLILLCCLWSPPVTLAQSTIDSTGVIVIRNIFLNGNRITKDHIIKRELTFAIGDTLPANEVQAVLQQSQQNLINTSLFNAILVNVMSYDDSSARDEVYKDILITMEERWYIWPSPIFDLADPNFNTWWTTRDFNRTNYGLYVDWENFRGRKEQLIFNFQLGYTKQAAIKYSVPYLNRRQRLGGSLTLIYKQNDEVAYRTLDNQRLLYSDGSGNAREDFATKLFLSLRNGLYHTHGLETRFNYSAAADSVPILASDYYASGNQVRYFSLTYTYTHDRRDAKAYPLQGHYLQGLLLKSGFGLGDPDLNVMYAQLTAKKYLPISDRWNFAASVTGRTLLSNELPYYFQEGLGYGYFVRGYEYYVIDGQHWGLLRSNLKLALLKPRWKTLEFIPTKKFNTFHYAFYLNVFADVGYVSDKLYAVGNPLSNETLYSTGIGLDFVTYYDKVLRLEYALNHIGETGFYIHFVQPI